MTFKILTKPKFMHLNMFVCPGVCACVGVFCKHVFGSHYECVSACLCTCLCVCVCVSVQARVCLFLALTDYLCERRWISEGGVSALMCGCLVMQSWFYLDSWCPV